MPTYAEHLEQALGDASDPSQALSFGRVLELDEREEYPSEACSLLDRLGVSDHYVPEADGGRLESFSALADVLRVVARRDLTTSIAHNITFFAATHVWVAGSPEQRHRVSSHIRGGGRMALSYHEEDHGSDVLATSTAAVPREGGYVLDGEKWFVNSATQADVHTVFARTSARGGPRGFSLFVVDKRSLAPGEFVHTPPLRTHGARGVDFSGIRFMKAPLGPEALVGRLGEGLELTLRSFQITRSVIPALSLGAADTALRTVLDFCVDRQVYGTTVFAIARPRAVLTDAFLDLLVCDCVVRATTRALHVIPGEARLWSAIAKAFVSRTVDRMLDALGEVLGARSFLRSGTTFAIFQKIARDHAAIPIFHAGGFVLLQTIGLTLAHVAAFRRGASATEKAAFAHGLEEVFRWDRDLPPFDPGHLAAYTRVRDSLLAFEMAASRLAQADALDRGAPPALRVLTNAFRTALERESAALADLHERFGASATSRPEFFDFCARYAIFHAAAVTLQTWLCNRDRMEPFLAEGAWLAAALARLLQALNIAVDVDVDAEREQVAGHLLRLRSEKRLFSVVPSRLAD